MIVLIRADVIYSGFVILVIYGDLEMEMNIAFWRSKRFHSL